MKRTVVLVLACVLLCCGCAPSGAVVGQWVSDDNPSFYFELYDDHTCVMFDAEDEWVSSGTYAVHNRQVVFNMDTGSFTWVRVGEVMRFEAGDTVVEYHRKA